MSPLNTKAEKEAYLINEQSWDERTRIHLGSAFYDIDGFLKGKSSLNPPELGLLGELRGKKVCTFNAILLRTACPWFVWAPK